MRKARVKRIDDSLHHLYLEVVQNDHGAVAFPNLSQLGFKGMKISLAFMQ